MLRLNARVSPGKKITTFNQKYYKFLFIFYDSQHPKIT